MLTDLHLKETNELFAIDGQKAILIAPHAEGGTIVRLAHEDWSQEFHVSEVYADVRYLLSEGTMQRVLRKSHEERGEPFNREHPFGLDKDAPF